MRQAFHRPIRQKAYFYCLTLPDLPQNATASFKMVASKHFAITPGSGLARNTGVLRQCLRHAPAPRTLQLPAKIMQSK